MLLFKLKCKLLLLVFLFSGLPLLHTQPHWTTEEESIAFVGLTLQQLIDRFGVPRLVYAARGLEVWQDDLVFVYDQGYFYIYRDRVWQVGIHSVRGISRGDPQGIIYLRMGENAVAQGNSFFYPLHVTPWPLMLRWDIDNAGRVQAIFIYRSDL